MNITPGYNFSVNEVPTRGLLQTMVAGMSVTGIDVEQISSALATLTLGETGATNTGTEGKLRVDNCGSLWVCVAQGEVKLWRANWGGWETRRIRVGAGQTPWNASPFPPVARGILGTSPVGDTSPSNVYFQPYVGANAQTNTWKLLETTSSGSYGRILGRGGFLGAATLANRLGFPDYMDTYQAAGSAPFIPRALPLVAIYSVSCLGLKQLQSSTFMAWLFGASMGEQ